MNNKNLICSDTMVLRNNSIPTVNVDGEIGMMSLERNNYYSVGSSSARIWEIIEEPKKVIDIVNILLEEYTVDKNRCLKEVINFLDELNSEKLLMIK